MIHSLVSTSQRRIASYAPNVCAAWSLWVILAVRFNSVKANMALVILLVLNVPATVLHDMSLFRVTFNPAAYFSTTRLHPAPELHNTFMVTDLPDSWYNLRNSMGTRSCFNLLVGVRVPGLIVDFIICLEDTVVKQSYVIQFVPKYLFSVLLGT